MNDAPSGITRFGIAEKALLILFVAIATLYPFFPATSYGAYNWYVTGFDDLLIFSATYLVAKKRHQELAAILGLLAAVLLMLALVAIAGETLHAFARYAKFGAAIPAFLAAKELWKYLHPEETEEETESWWMKYRMFGRAFFGYVVNSTDDIALNVSMVAGAYADQISGYLSGIALGAVTMVVLAIVIGKRIGNHPILQIIGYSVAAAVILTA